MSDTQAEEFVLDENMMSSRNKKLRDAGRRLREFESNLLGMMADFPTEDRPGCGYWHAHMPGSNSFIDDDLRPTKLRRSCVAAILRAAEKLRSLKPTNVSARVVTCLN